MSEQDDELLANVGRTGEIDSSKWNELRAKLLERLDQNLQRAFPLNDSSNVLPSTAATAFELQSEQELISRIKESLGLFTSAPPFTIQRIAELILYPNKHHRNKGKYLRALDRTLTVTSTTQDYPSIEPGVSALFTDTINEFPLFSPIPWASGTNPNGHYSSPPPEATTLFPITNGINGKHGGSGEPGLEESATQMSTGAPPPIDAVDIGIVSEEVARHVQEAGPPPRSMDDVNVSSEQTDAQEVPDGEAQGEEDKENGMRDVE